MLVCGCAVLLAACATRSGPSVPQPLTFITRADCVATDTMRTRFDAALIGLGWPKTYAFIDAETLAETDPRRGYGTPTILYKNVDLFGIPEPPAQKHAPT